MDSPGLLSKRLFSKTTLIHGACWILFILYELGVLYYLTGKLEPFYIYILYYGQNILFFYGNTRILDEMGPDLRSKFFKGTLLYILLFCLYLLTKLSLELMLEKPATAFARDFRYYRNILVKDAFRGIYFTVLATFYWAAGHIAAYRRTAEAAEKKRLVALKEKAELEVKLQETRNAYLQQQLSPHLLFNALNFIYEKVYKESEAAARCVLLLAEIMRFSLAGTAADGKVPLQLEVEQLQRLLEINRFRFDHDLHLEVDFKGRFKEFRIIPLILFTLAENVFKHGSLKDPGNPAVMHLTVSRQGELTFFTRNAKKAESRFRQAGQIGLQNVRTRLDFAYPGKYRLGVCQTEECFELTLNLSL
jgi:two-component system LytT family sensor kinase